MFLNDWKENGVEGMKSDFGIGDDELDGVVILLASYTYEDYSGYAYVLFTKDGKLFEVHGSHCSCFGLSESDYSGSGPAQWQPEETSIAAIKHQLQHDTYKFDGIREELSKVLKSLD